MSRVSPTARLSALLPLLAVATAQAQGTVNQYGNPLKHPPKPTTAAITAEELRTRLYIFADDSMMGRQVGREGNMKGTDYIAGELKRLGVEPAGENGTYFQTLPYVQRKFTDRSTLSVNGAALAFNTDFVPVPGAAAPRAISGAQVIYGGVAGDTTRQITPEQAAGKFVILSAAPAATRPVGAAPIGAPAVQASFEGGCPVAGAGGPAGGAARGGFAGFGGGNAAARFPNAVAVATVDLDALSPAARAALNNPQAQQSGGGGRGAAGGAGAAASPDLVVVANGKVGIVRDGALAAGTLPAGWTPATVKAKADSMAKKSADSSARVAARRDSIVATAKALLAARTRRGSLTFDGERIALDSAQILALACQPTAAGRGPGGGNGGLRAGGNTAGGAPAAPAAVLRLTSAAAAKLLGRPVDGAQPGATGGSVTASLDYVEQPTKYGRNVVGIIRGSDPTLAGEYVAIGGHNDHVGYSTPVDHDSLKAWNNANLRLQMASGDLRAITAEQRASIKVNMDSIRKLHPVARMDSISNGADDDGSGSMAVLEIAEAIAKMPVKPKRSILFVWHTGEEAGLVGSRFFAANPTVPVDSIVAQINIDMIGRGRAEDVIGGGPTYVGAVGSKRLSQELYRDMLAANARQKTPLTIDYRFDDATLGVAVDGKPASWPGYNNIYGRSDHANYANKCIPIVFFFTGLHGDYHQRTDEPQYIDYPHYAAITNYVRDLLVDVGNRPTRPALDNVCTRR